MYVTDKCHIPYQVHQEEIQEHTLVTQATNLKQTSFSSPN
jgi:hypothetical protein